MSVSDKREESSPIASIRRSLAAHRPIEHVPAGYTQAAVALTLRSIDAADPEILFIKRAEFAGDPWSAQIAFPGGRAEPGDSDLLHTALRETMEELAVDLAVHGEVLGRLDDLKPVSVHIPRIVVRPYVLTLRGNPDLRPSPEVAEAFWIPLRVLRSADCWRMTRVTARNSSFEAKACHFEGHVIWGITERILTQFLTLTA